eukprot:7761170-Ditylum_brightwellii.AAC.1
MQGTKQRENTTQVNMTPTVSTHSLTIVFPALVGLSNKIGQGPAATALDNCQRCDGADDDKVSTQSIWGSGLALIQK